MYTSQWTIWKGKLVRSWSLFIKSSIYEDDIVTQTFIVGYLRNQTTLICRILDLLISKTIKR